MDVSVIIPNWNGRELLEKNLDSVLSAKGNLKNKIREIIIVDDKSTDTSVSYLEKDFAGKVKIIKHTVNRGFPSAVNTGVRAAKGVLVCLLNTDVAPSPNFLEKVVAHFSSPLVFGVSLHERGYGAAVGRFKGGFIDIGGPGKQVSTTRTFWVSGGSGVFRRSFWMKLKGMDEEVFSPYYWEDIDLGYRGQKRGYSLLWEPESMVVHEHESTTKKLDKRRTSLVKERNHLLFIWKNITSPNLFRKHLLGLVKRTIRHPGYLRIVLMALGKLSIIKKKRKQERKDAKVSDESIFAKFA